MYTFLLSVTLRRLRFACSIHPIPNSTLCLLTASQIRFTSQKSPVIFPAFCRKVSHWSIWKDTTVHFPKDFIPSRAQRTVAFPGFSPGSVTFDLVTVSWCGCDLKRKQWHNLYKKNPNNYRYCLVRHLQEKQGAKWQFKEKIAFFFKGLCTAKYP